MMGKYSASSEIEIIPISDTTHTNNTTSTLSVSNSVCSKNSRHLKRNNMQRMPYMSDPTLVPRVQKYLESNVDKTYVDISVMADDLQQKYKEYARRKRSAFRTSVKKAYSIVLQSYGIADQDQSSSDEDASDDETPDEEEGTFASSTMNNQLLDLYRRPVIPNKIDENELIDISSDDSEDNTQEPPSKKPNIAPTPVQPKVTIQLQCQNNVSGEASQDKNEPPQQPPLNDKGKKRKAEITALPFQSSPKKKKSLATLQEPSVTFKDVGGIEDTLVQVCNLIKHISHPEIYTHIGIRPPRGFLLHGPPGCGKTLLANAVAGELGIPLLQVAAPELVAGISGESEERIRELFERALCTSPCVLFIEEVDAITPNRLFAQKDMERRIVAQLISCLDDLGKNENGNRVLVIGATNRPDSIDPALRRAGRFDREIRLGMPNAHSREQILKIATKSLKLCDDFDYQKLANLTPGYVGADLMSLTMEAASSAVNRTFSIMKERWKLQQQLAIETENKLRRDKEKEMTNDLNKSDPEIIVDDIVEVTKPDEVKNGTSESTSDDPVVVIDDDVKTTDSSTEPIEVTVNGDKTDGEDLPGQEPMPVDVKQPSPLEDALFWIHDKTKLSDENLKNTDVTMDDFEEALKRVQPSATREGFATVPDITWDDIGSLRDIREELQMAILGPVTYPDKYAALGFTKPGGVLLYGPSGCGKTLVAKAIANEAGINFISVKGPELLRMYVGESERAVRECFQRARNSAPCVIFFDELDGICPKRSDSKEGGVEKRVVNQLLTEMDGVEGRKGVYILAASNLPDKIDSAILRPGRLDRLLFVGLPTAADRADILRVITKNGTIPRLAPDVDLDVIGKSEECKGYTGADLTQLVREASTEVLKEYLKAGDRDKPTVVTTEHFNKAIKKIRPSVMDIKYYEKMRKIYSTSSENNEVEEMEYS